MTGHEEQDPLDRLLEQFTSAVRRGEPADVDSWAERHPEHAEQILELFPTVLAIEGLRDETSRSGSGARIGVGVIERLGDYRILSEIGRGGMGVVYEAEQESLGRHVAVKVLPPIRNPKRIQRFEREARTAARLHHTNIVPIFGVGEHEGWHYYVMQVIRGVGLDVVLRALRAQAWESDGGQGRAGLTPEEAVRMLRSGAFRATPRGSATERSASGPASTETATTPESGTTTLEQPDPGPPTHSRAPYWRSVAEIGRQVADALAYAHGQSVLHRDVKPGNLLLDAHGVVWVTDFGLAKAVGYEGITISGDLVGTLQYMAPEQLHGRYDARTDVYGLGLTLYELLTLRPAFVDGDRGSLIKKIEQGNPTPPSQLRKGIPHDLETVVLKAIQHDPRHRYQTAAELADDLQRFLEDRPIRARRATPIEQLWRWGRRNRAVASLAAVALIAVLGAAVAGWTGYVTSRSALQRASKNLDTALEAFDDMFEWIAGVDRIEIVVDQTGDEASYEWYAPSSVTEEDTALLEKMLAFYDRFAEENADSKELRAESAKAHRRVGDLLLQLRRLEDAERAYRSALDTYEKLDAGSGTHQVMIAAIHNDLGRVRMESQGGREARSEFEDVLEMLAGDDSRAARFERARAHEHLGLVSFARRRFERDGRRNTRPRVPNDTDQPPPPPQEDRGNAPPPERPEGPRRDFFRQSIEHLRAAYALARALAGEQPDNPAFQLAAARVGRHLLSFGFRTRSVDGGWVEGSAQRDEIAKDSVTGLERVAALYPDVAVYQVELAKTCLAAVPAGAGADLRRGRRQPVPRTDGGDDYARHIARAVELAEKLHAAHPEETDPKRLLADALADSAEWTGEDTSAAVAALRRAIALRESIDSPFEARPLFEHRTRLVVALAWNGEGTAAVDQAIALIDDLEPRVDGGNERAFVLRFYREPFAAMVVELQRLGATDEIERFERRVQEFAGR